MRIPLGNELAEPGSETCEALGLLVHLAPALVHHPAAGVERGERPLYPALQAIRLA
jgi:hypothetical protein